MRNLKKSPHRFWIWWSYPHFKDPTPYLNQKHLKASGPNKKVVLICLIGVVTALVVLLIQVIARFF